MTKADISKYIPADQQPQRCDKTVDIEDALKTSVKWPCSACDKVFSAQQEMLDHFAAFHNDEEADLSAHSPHTPGIYQVEEEAYHAGDGISRSELWTVHNKTPHHWRYGERKETKAQTFGKAIHTAVLEPELFDVAFFCGPDDRRGGKWDAAVKIAAANGKTCITSGDYDDALKIRDIAHRNPMIRKLTKDKPSIEQSAYAIDEKTGELMKVRPDIYSHTLRVMADLKSTTSSAPYDFQKSVAEYGYHLHDFMYPIIWEAAGGAPVDGFVFICIEKAAPWAIAVYELSDSARREAQAIYRVALDNISECMKLERKMRADNEASKSNGNKGLDPSQLNRAVAASCWPSYSPKVQPLDLPMYAYNLTKP